MKLYIPIQAFTGPFRFFHLYPLLLLRKGSVIREIQGAFEKVFGFKEQRPRNEKNEIKKAV